MLIETSIGAVDDSLLEKREGVDEDDNAIASWVEYWSDGVLVHRSCHVDLKHGLLALAVAGDVNG